MASILSSVDSWQADAYDPALEPDGFEAVRAGIRRLLSQDRYRAFRDYDRKEPVVTLPGVRIYPAYDRAAQAVASQDASDNWV